MNTYHSYEIAGVGINVNTDNRYIEKRLKTFTCEEVKTPELHADIKSCSYIEEPSGEVVVDELMRWLRKNSGGGGFHILRKNGKDGRVMACIDTDENWNNVIIKYLNTLSPEEKEGFGPKSSMEYYSFLLMGIAFRNRLINRGGLVIHASSIAWEDRGILFTAPSGTGKSTHVRLWEKYLGKEVKVVNDDTPAVSFRGGTPLLCGTPWSGSTQKFSNIKVPVKAVVVLQQAPENTIRQLTQAEALPYVMPRVFLPYFDSQLMEKAYSILDKLIGHTPVYLLKCTPQRKAMELVYQCMK